MRPSPTPHRLRLFLIEWLFLGMALLALGGFMAFSLTQEYRQINLRESQRLMAQARVVDENLGRQLNAANLALTSILAELRYWQGKQDGIERANRQLKTISDAMPGVRTMLMMDADGNVLAADKKELLGKNFSHREYFQTVIRNPNPDTLFVGAPFKTVLGVFAINVIRMIPGSQGKFAGIISATLDPEEFGILLDSVRYAEDMRVSLIHGDGSLLLMAPMQDGMLGQDLARSGTSFSLHRDSGQMSSLLSGGEVGAEEGRMIVLRTIRPRQLNMDKPLVVSVSRGLPALYSTWQRDVIVQSGWFVLLSLAVGLVLFFYQRWQRKFEHLASSYRADLLDREERLRLATEADGVGVWEYDLVSKKLSWDDSMFVIYGIDPSSVSALYEAWKNSLVAEDLADTETALKEAIHGRKKFDVQFRILRGDGEVRAIRALAKVHFDDAGRAVKMVGINEDITERQCMEHDLRIAATAFETQDGMMVTDHNNIILRVNRSFTRLTGYSAEEALGKSPKMLRSGRQDEAFYRQMWETLLQARFWEGEIWNRRKNGEIYPEWLTITAVAQPDGKVVNYVGIFSDITERKIAEEQIQNLAFYDPLTRLPNRRLLLDRFSQAQFASARRKNYGAVLFLDLDKFKVLNDTHGHEVGDLLLIEVAHRLLSCVRAEDTVARLGGDEFVVVLEELSKDKQVAAEQAGEVAEKIRLTLDAPYAIQGLIHASSSSIGVCLFNGTEQPVNELLTQADKAMYQAKSAGRDAVCFFDPAAPALGD